MADVAPVAEQPAADQPSADATSRRRFDLLDAPLAIATVGGGALTLRNRLVMVPMASAKASVDGTVTAALCEHYACRAAGAPDGRGLLGLVQTEHHFVSAEGQATARQASASRDRDIEGLRLEAAAVQQYNTPVFLQVNHAGSAAAEKICGHRPIAPSSATCPGAKPGHALPRTMDAADIARVTQAFADAARRARLAGFDGVEVHAAHGYLLDQFFSPLTNYRDDEYGTLAGVGGRLRLTLEVLDAVRSELGAGMSVSVRLGGCDYMEGGSTIEDACAAAVLLQRAGAHVLSLSGGMNYYSRRDTMEPGWFADMSIPVRAALADAADADGSTPIPVILAGGIKRYSQAEDLLARGAMDLAGIGRAILGNAHWAWKRR